MAIIGGFLGGGVEMVPAGQSQLCLQWLTPNRENLSGAVFTITGTGSTSGQYTVSGGADGRAEYIVPVGEYDVSVSHGGDYSNDLPQHVVAESTQSYLVLFNSFMEGVSGVMFSGEYLDDVDSYEIVDTNGEVYQTGDEWFKDMIVILPVGSYIARIVSSGTIEIPFTISAVGLEVVDMSPYTTTITISTMSSFPIGTSITVGKRTLIEKSIWYVPKDSSNHSLSYTCPNLSSKGAIATIPQSTISANSESVSVSPQPSGAFLIFTASETTKVPAGKYRVIAVGGGGGGGKVSYSEYYPGGGGGGGGYIEEETVTLESDESVTITIGAGGTLASSSSGKGSNGGATSFGTYVSASGGSGGYSGGASVSLRGCGGSGGSGGGGGRSSDSTANAYAGAGGRGYFGGGGGGGGAPSGRTGGTGGAGGTYGGKGGNGQYQNGYNGAAGTVSSDDMYGTGTARGGTGDTSSGGGGGGGGGYSANGGNGGYGGGGGGGARGGKGGQGSSSGSSYPGTGNGAGGGGDSYDHDWEYGGGGGGGYGTSSRAKDTTGGDGCVAIQWTARQ